MHGTIQVFSAAETFFTACYDANRQVQRFSVKCTGVIDTHVCSHVVVASQWGMEEASRSRGSQFGMISICCPDRRTYAYY